MSQAAFRLGPHVFAEGEMAVMAIVNRTPDSFYDKGATYARDAAIDRVAQAVDEGARIIDIGGVKAGPGQLVDAAEEIRRTAPFVEAVREGFPDVAISVDTWRAEVGDVVCRAGAHLLNDAWGGYDPGLAEVAARHGVGLVCMHTGGAEPRTRPHRVQYADVMADVVRQTKELADRAEALGVPRESILVDPGHDFGKNTRHSLEVTRRLGELAGLDRPMLVSLSNKDFVGESLDVPLDQRLTGTLAATAVCAWLGARIFRAHEVRETKQVVDMVAAIAGTRQPAVARRGLA
jgi:dihydropteroate synthase